MFARKVLFLALLIASPLSEIADAQDVPAKQDDVYCLTYHVDLMRRQSTEWESEGPFTIDEGTKHTPFVTFNEATRKATVIVGNGDDVGGVYHPMVASDNPATVHFVMTIYLVDQDNTIFAVETLDPNTPAPATAVFDVPEEVTEVTPFEFCNLHGLWKGETVSTGELGSANATSVTSEEKTGETVIDTATMVCGIDSPVSVAYDSFAADFIRRQSLPPFDSLVPYDLDDGSKHVPFIHLNGNGTATVTVGEEGSYHVMKGASQELDENGEPVQPHWITEVYAVDQNGDIVTMQSLNPSNVDIAQITFDIPQSATTLTAYEWCNIHGLYVGPTVDVATGEVISTNTHSDPTEEAAASGAAGVRTLAMAGAMVAAALLV